MLFDVSRLELHIAGRQDKNYLNKLWFVTIFLEMEIGGRLYSDHAGVLAIWEVYQ